MTALLWPGDQRGGDALTDAAVLDAMVAVESAWLSGLVQHGIAPREAARELAATDEDLAHVCAASESSGNPVPPLLARLRERLPEPAARWVHRGLTSQDVLDTALMICLRDVASRVHDQLVDQLDVLGALARAHRDTIMVARTLTQFAVPTTFGRKVSTWLLGLLDAAHELGRLDFPAQFGGAAGTQAATVELAARTGHADPRRVAASLVEGVAITLGLRPSLPWHTARAPVLRVAGAFTGCTDAWGRIANDVLVLARPEIGELAEAAGRGGSSTMPQKANPVLSVLVRRAALAAPPTLALLHTAAADVVDERPDGAWHVEWQPLQLLGRRTLVAGSHTTELCRGIRVDTARMRANLESAGGSVTAERDSMRSVAGAAADTAPDGAAGYLGLAGDLTDETLQRAAQLVSEYRS